MKKIYATILAGMLCTTAMFAQEEEDHGFYFQQKVGDEYVDLANGATLTISEVSYSELVPGVLCIEEMDPNLYVVNNMGYSTKATMECDGILNYHEIEFCFGQCIEWRETPHLSQEQTIPATAPFKAFIHIGGKNCPNKDFSVNASVKLTLYPSADSEDVVTLTLVFDTNASGVKDVNKDSHKLEVFNLCGKKIANSTEGLAKGVYIVRQDGTSRKVTIR